MRWPISKGWKSDGHRAWNVSMGRWRPYCHDGNAADGLCSPSGIESWRLKNRMTDFGFVWAESSKGSSSLLDRVITRSGRSDQRDHALYQHHANPLPRPDPVALVD